MTQVDTSVGIGSAPDQRQNDDQEAAPGQAFLTQAWRLDAATRASWEVGGIADLLSRELARMDRETAENEIRPLLALVARLEALSNVLCSALTDAYAEHQQVGDALLTPGERRQRHQGGASC